MVIFLDDGIFKCDRALQLKQPCAVCFSLLHSVVWPWVSLLAPCPASAQSCLLPFPEGETIPKGMVTIACILGEFKSSLVYVGSTTSHKFSVGEGFWQETTKLLRCAGMLHLSLRARSPPNCCAKKEPYFSCIWQHEKTTYPKWWFSCHVIHWFQCKVRRVLHPLALCSLESVVTRYM